MFFSNTKIVGKEIKKNKIKDFYYTVSASTNPPVFQRYRIYAEDNEFFFYHEKREGDHWPLREDDITVSGKVKLTSEQWDAFYGLLEGGKVTKRKTQYGSGGRGPFTFLYWKGERRNINEFSFRNYSACESFGIICDELKESQK